MPAAAGVNLPRVYRSTMPDPRRARLFASSVGFVSAFGTARAMAYAARAGIPPFHFVTRKGVHVHHLVYGIGLLLLLSLIHI
mgnify:CR=1 FL=1